MRPPVKSSSFVSVVLVLERRRDALPDVIIKLQQLLDAHYTDYELLLVAQGPLRSPVDSPALQYLLQTVPCVRYIQLSAKVHEDVAWAAGLENAIGDFVVLFNHTCDPLSIVTASVDMCKAGTDVVVGVSPRAQTLAYRCTRSLGELLLRAVDYRLPKNATTFRCMSRRAVNAVTSTGRFQHTLYLRIQKTGYPTASLPYTVSEYVKTRKSLPGGISHFLRLMVFNSSRPLRWMSLTGLAGSTLAFIFAAFSLLTRLGGKNVAEGWTTTILFMSMLFMLQFIMLAFFGEYLGRLLEDRNEHDDYSVVFEKNSSIMVDQNRLNVLDRSTSPEQNLVQTGRDR